MDLSIVIVSWNTRDLLRDCLQSVDACMNSPELTRHWRYETIVVDNVSTDGTREMLAEQFREIKVIENSENTGFTGGNNQGLTSSSGKYILLLNPDTVIQPGAIPAMIEYLEMNTRVAVVGPQLLNEDLTVQSSRRRFPNLRTAIFESTWLQGLAPTALLDHYYMRDIPDDLPAPVDWVQGAAMMVRHAVLKTVGAFDESFFMYSEELDLQKRIKSAGWEIHYYPRAQIVHYGGKSSDQVVAQRHIYFQDSKVRYFRKHHGTPSAVFLRSVLLLNYGWQLVLETAKLVFGHKTELRKSRIAAYQSVLKHGLRGK